MYSEDTLLRLVERIYDAATDASKWSVFLTELSTALGATGAGLLQHEVRPNVLIRGRILASSTLHPEGTRLYAQRYAALDPWGNALARQRRLDSDYLFTSESLVPDSQLRRTEFYNDFSRYYDIAGNVGFGVATEPGIATTVTVIRGHRMPPFGAKELRLMAALQPHVRRALRVHHRLSEALQHSAAVDAILDRLPFGVVLVDASGGAILVNHAAQQILDTRDGLSLRDGSLFAASVPQTSELRNLIAQAIAVSGGDPLQGSGGALAIGRPSLKRPLQVLVTPLRPAGAALMVGSASPSAVVFVSDPESRPLTDEAILRQFFGLTPAETRLALQLLQQKSVEEAAEILEISVNTARTYMKKLFEKTGTRRQAELLQLLGGGVGQLRR